MSVADWEQSKTRLTIQKNVFFKMTAIIKRNWSRVELSGLASLSRKSFGDNCKIASSLHHIIPALLILNQFSGVNISTTFILSCSTMLWVFFLCIKVSESLYHTYVLYLYYYQSIKLICVDLMIFYSVCWERF